MKISAKLDSLNSALTALNEASKFDEGKSFLDGFSLSESSRISMKDDKTDAEKKEILDWFISKGATFSAKSEIKRPMFERKNSKKREKTTWYKLSFENLYIQLAHTSEKQNYQESVWAFVGVGLLREKCIFGYYNRGMLDYVKKAGLELIETPTEIKE